MIYNFGFWFLLGMFVMYMVLDIWHYKQIKNCDVVLKISSPALKIIQERINHYAIEKEKLKKDIGNDNHLFCNAERLKQVDYMVDVLSDIKGEIAGKMWDIDPKRRII